MELFDTHCHIDVAEFDRDRMQVLKRARQAGVQTIVVPGIHAAGWRDLLDLCSDQTGLYAALGLHPVYLERHRDPDLEVLERLLEKEAPIAVGEIGLDFFVPGLDRKGQERLLEAQLVLAREAGLPVLLHVRKAHDQVLGALKRTKTCGGIAHAFNGSLDQAKRYIDLGFKLGFGGMLTYARSTKLRHLARSLPLGALVLETDAPDMTVASHHGQRNSPEYLPECLLALAEAREESAMTLATATTRNAREVLRLVPAAADSIDP